MSTQFAPFETTFSAIVGRLIERYDTTPGSAARTLLEAVARELAVSYQTIDLAYRAGFLDTAEGQALDHVVSVLGVTRARAGRLTGQVEFIRAAPAPADITIPAGRRLTCSETNDFWFETTETGILRRGELSTIVPVQEVLDDKEPSLEAPKDLPAIINADMLTVMPRPVLGIDQVRNPLPLQRSSEDETDEHLRARAQTALRDQESGTLAAIQAAILAQGVKQATVREPADGPPGIVEAVIDDPLVAGNESLKKRVEDAIRKTKAAGIRVNTYYACRVYLEPSFQVDPVDERMDEAAFALLCRSLQKDLQVFAAALPVGAPVNRRRLELVLFNNPAVRHVTPVEMSAWVQSGTDTDENGKPVLTTRAMRLDSNGEWNIGLYETAIIDIDLRPPLIERYQPTQYRLDIEITVSADEKRTMDEVRQDVRAAIATYESGLKLQQRQLLAAPTGQDAALEMTFNTCEQYLEDDADVTLTRLHVTTPGQSATTTLVKGGSTAITAKSWRVVTGNITATLGAK